MASTSGSTRLTSPSAVPVEHYDAVAKLFHWTIVVLLIVQYATKFIPPKSFSWSSKEGLNAWHFAVGPTILLLMLLRLGWRLTHHTPPPPADLPTGLQVLSRATHWLFYAILIVLPILGWLAASGFGATPTLLGLFPLPALIGPNKSLGETLGSIHGILALVLLAIIALHVTGALYHALVKRDGVIRRMLPSTG